MKKLWIVPAAALAVLLVGCGHKEAAVEPVAPAPVQATVVAVEAVEAPRLIELQGVVMPEKETYLSSRAMGPVVKVLANAGDLVRKGDLLVEIQQDLSHGQLSQAKGGLAQAEAALALASRNFERFRKLHEKAACSELELDMARMQHEQAKGAVEQAKGAVAAAGSVADESAVRAPFDAVVVERMVNLGDLSAPGRPIARLQSRTGRRLQLTVRETDAPFVKLGMSLPVTLDSRPDLGSIPGRVVEVVPAADMATHTFLVRVELETSDVMSGLSGRTVLPGAPRASLTVPVEAVLRTGGLSLAVAVDAEGKARTRAVTTGAQRDGRVEVLSGLAADDRVVSPLVAPIADGTPVQAN